MRKRIHGILTKLGGFLVRATNEPDVRYSCVWCGKTYEYEWSFPDSCMHWDWRRLCKLTYSPYWAGVPNWFGRYSEIIYRLCFGKADEYTQKKPPQSGGNCES